MSAPDDDATPGLVPYRVGYAKPPEDSRFKKGRSGNPNGRPRKTRAKKPDWDPVLRPTDGLILEEAYRPVTIREGDKKIELPAIQASMRALAISAMKGSRLSQKQLSDIVRTVEARKNAEQLEVLEVMIEYKQKWTNELERRERLAITAPDPVPHPDDIFIDLRNGKIEIDGPMDEKQKAFWDERFQRMTDAQVEVSTFAQKHRKARDPRRRVLWLDEWHFEQRIFDLLNDSLPQKYKRRLENRSFAAGASREGKTLDEFRRKRKLQKERVRHRTKHLKRSPSFVSISVQTARRLRQLTPLHWLAMQTLPTVLVPAYRRWPQQRS